MLNINVAMSAGGPWMGGAVLVGGGGGEVVCMRGSIAASVCGRVFEFLAKGRAVER
jgi:hypothetical protein